MKVLEFKNYKKISAIIKIELQRQMAYRLEYVFYRLVNLFEVLVLIVIWSAIYKTSDVVSGYTYKEMMTYITIGWLLFFLTSNYGFDLIVSKQIQDGTLNTFLLKPINYIKYLITLSIGRTSIALISGIVMQVIVIFCMFNKIIFNFNLINWLIILIMVVLGYFISLFVSILTGMIAFWLTFISGTRYTLVLLIRLLSGKIFPLNMLPIVFYKLSLFFPFVYIYFMPLQLYLGKISTLDGLKALGVEAIWLILLYLLIKLIWKKGLKRYEGVGI